MSVLCIAGKNDIAVNVLDYARHQGYELLAVLNRNENYTDSWQYSAGLYCSRNNIPTATLEDIYPVKNLVFISVEFDRIIDPSKFASPNLFNLHFSLLPKYKGCNTSIMPILHGESESGVTLHRIRRGIDTGEIIAQTRIAIDFDCTGFDLYRKYIDAGSRLVIEYLDRLISNDFTETLQDFMHSEYFSRREIDYGSLQLNTSKTAWQIHNQIRAFAFRPYQLLTFRNCGLIGSTITDNVSLERPGTILEETETHFLLSAIDYDIYAYKDVLNDLLASLMDNDNERAKSLCEFRGIISDKNSEGISPMSLAVSRNNLEMVKFFAKKTLDAIELSRYTFGNRQQATGNRQQATGNRQQATGLTIRPKPADYYTSFLREHILHGRRFLLWRNYVYPQASSF